MHECACMHYNNRRGKILAREKKKQREREREREMVPHSSPL